MEKDIYEKIIRDAKSMEKILDGDYSEFKELEKDPNVQRYIYLNRLKNSYRLNYYGKNSIVGEILEQYGEGLIENTNNIWCYALENEARKIYFSGVDRSDPYKIWIVYMDLENNKKTIAISKENQEKFESTHKIAYKNPNIDDFSDGYYNIRHRFFEDCINEGQEIAIQKILAKPTDKQ